MNKLSILKFNNPKFLNIIQSQVSNGYPVLIEDVDDSLDPAIDTVLAKAYYEADGRLLIKLGDKEVGYHTAF